MKVKIKKSLLKESNMQGIDLGYSDIENVRIMIGKMIDRAVITPNDGAEFLEEPEEGEPLFPEDETIERRDDPKRQMTKKDYVNRIRDVVKGGRKVPYLYYAYKGIDDDGNILNNNDIGPVMQLQLSKAGQLVTRLEHSGDASVDMFLCDFGKILQLHDEWDKRYEERMKDLLPKAIYNKMATKKGYDRGTYQAGRQTNIRPFSTVAIGRGTKPVFHQNVDFMYKTSPEPNRKIDPNDLWAFSIRVPLAIAYMILSNMGMPSRPTSRDQEALNKFRQARKQAARERLNVTPQKIADAYNHWASNKDKYVEKYMKVMKQEPNSWVNYFDQQKTMELFNLDFDKFNDNYIEAQRTGEYEKEKQDLQDEFGTHWSEQVPSYFNSLWLQFPPLQEGGYETLLEDLKDPNNAKKIAKSIINSMVVNKNNQVKKNIAGHLQHLVINYSDHPAVENNIGWMQHALQQYYIMGGQ